MRYLFLAFLYFPGTVLHELSHYCAARLLQVPVGRISLVPKFQGNGLQLGSVEIGKTDFIRRFLIGIAPLLSGLTVLSAVLYIVVNSRSLSALHYVVLGYVSLTVVNTMNLSESDLRGAWKVILILVLAIVFVIALH
jgi:hypothetical protein